MITVTDSKPATIEIVKGCPSKFPSLTKGLKLSVKFETVTITSAIEGVTPYKAVRVHFGAQSVYLAGNRVKIPELTAGREFNLHNGSPLEYVRIRIA